MKCRLAVVGVFVFCLLRCCLPSLAGRQEVKSIAGHRFTNTELTALYEVVASRYVFRKGKPVPLAKVGLTRLKGVVFRVVDTNMVLLTCGKYPFNKTVAVEVFWGTYDIVDKEGLTVISRRLGKYRYFAANRTTHTVAKYAAVEPMTTRQFYRYMSRKKFFPEVKAYIRLRDKRKKAALDRKRAQPASASTIGR